MRVIRAVSKIFKYPILYSLFDPIVATKWKKNKDIRDLPTHFQQAKRSPNQLQPKSQLKLLGAKK